MAFTILLTDEAREGLKRLHPKIQQQVAKKMAFLLDSAEPPGSKKLKGHTKLWRLRTGEYRIVYHAPNAAGVIEVALIGNRSTIYRLL